MGAYRVLIFLLLLAMTPMPSWAAAPNCGNIADGTPWRDLSDGLIMQCKSGVRRGLGQASSVLSRLIQPAALSGSSVNVVDANYAIAIPGNSFVYGVKVVVTEEVTGATGIDVGYAAPEDPKRWAANLAVTVGTSSDIENFGIVTPTFEDADTHLVLTAVGGNFTGGLVDVTVYYQRLEDLTTGVGGVSTTLYGSLAAQPAPGVPGRLYYVTNPLDERDRYDNGLMWSDKLLHWDYITGKPTVNEQAKISSGDTTTGYLESKMLAGSNISITKENAGGDEKLRVAASGGASPLTVREEDGSPSEAGVTTIRLPNGTLIVNSAGNVSYVPTGGTGFPPSSQQRIIPVHAGAMSVQGSSTCDGPVDSTINGWRRPTIHTCPDNSAALIDFEVPLLDITTTEGPGWQWDFSDIRLHWQTVTTNSAPAGIFGVNIACRCIARSASDTIQVPSMTNAVSFDTNYSGFAQYRFRTISQNMTVAGGAVITGNCTASDFSHLACRAQVDATATDASYQPTTTHIWRAQAEITEVWQP